jgi:hypothetical protein
MSLSITMKMESYVSPVHESLNNGNLTMKSIVIDYYGLSSISRLFSYLYGRCLAALFHI